MVSVAEMRASVVVNGPTKVGMLTPSAGGIVIDGADVTAFSDAKKTDYRLNHLGYIFQDSVKKRMILFGMAIVLAVLLMFHLVCFSWLLFRAQSMTQVWLMLVQMATHWSITPFACHCLATIAFFCVPLFVFEWWLNRNDDLLLLLRVPWLTRGLFYVYCVLMMVFFCAETPHEFIYFQF